MAWDAWWLWMLAGIGLLILEVFAPGFLFLGFAIGTILMGTVLFGAAGAIPSLPVALLITAVISLLAWLVMRKMLGIRTGQIKVIDRDINED